VVELIPAVLSVNVRKSQLLPANQATDVFGRHGENVSEVLEAFFPSDGARPGECSCCGMGLVGERCGVAHAVERVEVGIGGECYEVGE
jgi:hypothetical protein